jgi:hypothetical protein
MLAAVVAQGWQGLAELGRQQRLERRAQMVELRGLAMERQRLTPILAAAAALAELMVALGALAVCPFLVRLAAVAAVAKPAHHLIRLGPQEGSNKQQFLMDQRAAPTRASDHSVQAVEI